MVLSLQHLKLNFFLGGGHFPPLFSIGFMLLLSIESPQKFFSILLVYEIV